MSLKFRDACISDFYTWDPSGNVAQRFSPTAGNQAYVFDGFGAPGLSPTGDPFTGFGGQWGGQTDSETGLTLFTHRYYDPGTGRWLTRDPIGYDGGVNLYAYCESEPIDQTDPLGFSGSKPGGPYHPPTGVHTACKPGDDCNTIRNKIYLLQRMISSHEGWDRNVPKPRGGNRHIGEIGDLYIQLANCYSLLFKKCGGQLKPPIVPFPVPIPGPKPGPSNFAPSPGPTWGNNGSISCHPGDGYGGPPRIYHY